MFGRCCNTLLKGYDNSITTDTSQTCSRIYIEVCTRFDIWIVFNNQDIHGCCWLKKLCYTQRKNSHIFRSRQEHGTVPHDTHECQLMAMVDTTSTEPPVIKRICTLRSLNTLDTYSRKEYEKDSANTPVHDEVDYSIVSHNKSTFLVQSHLGQEEGGEMVRTLSTAAPSLKMIGYL